MRIGIDLGGTTVKAALCTEDGTLLCKDSLPTRTGNAAGLKADMKRWHSRCAWRTAVR